jgi:hypothetical protein
MSFYWAISVGVYSCRTNYMWVAIFSLVGFWQSSVLYRIDHCAEASKLDGIVRPCYDKNLSNQIWSVCLFIFLTGSAILVCKFLNLRLRFFFTELPQRFWLLDVLFQISFQGSQIKHYPGIFGLLAKVNWPITKIHFPLITS